MTCNTFYQFQSVQAIVFVQTIDRCETVVFFSQRKLAGIYQPLSSAGEWWQNGAFDQICLQRRAVLTSCQANDVKGTSLTTTRYAAFEIILSVCSDSDSISSRRELCGAAGLISPRATDSEIDLNTINLPYQGDGGRLTTSTAHCSAGQHDCHRPPPSPTANRPLSTPAA